MCKICDSQAARYYSIADFLDIMADEELEIDCPDEGLAERWRSDAEFLRDRAEELDHRLKIDPKKLKVKV